ncbi:ATP-dependent DNA helicase RecQ [Staphylococcus aureus]|uniref:ATP-dependent DNA helicase RecQ n=1 Tax=Staphylococcus aureus TaxID=1280 RepID=A0A380E2V1_STAAU|nr:ATP-dependent DNA helicase RecQ [Staphylococcus aureus]
MVWVLIKKIFAQSFTFIFQQVLLNYIQEIGRAGRDGELSQAISLFQPDDKYILETLLFADMITEEDVQNFEIGEFLAPDKQDVLTTLHSFYSIGALKQIFKQII